jgi:hypothetical protein
MRLPPGSAPPMAGSLGDINVIRLELEMFRRTLKNRTLLETNH